MNKIQGKVTSIIKYILPSVATMVLYCLILFRKGIYPFGTETIDYYDMAQQIAAFYYHVYDSLHGGKAFFFDWYSALGTNMAMSTSGCSNISLFNLFFLFIKRNRLLESLSVFNMIKMMSMSFTMYFYLHKRFRASYFYELLLSIGYGFCGFVLVLYITNQWMDIAVLFPLIVYFAGKAISERKWIGYLVTLSLALINSYYITFMIFIYLFLIVGTFMLGEFIFAGKGNKKEAIKKYDLVPFGVATVFSMLISAFILMPQIYQTLSSARFKNENGEGLLATYLGIISQVNGAYTTRWWSLLLLSLPAVIILRGIIKHRKDKKSVFIVIFSIVLVTLELFLESVNLIWHFGSYIQYPIRNGFMIYFVVVSAACHFLSLDNKEDATVLEPSGKSRTSRIVVIIASVILTCITLVAFNVLSGEYAQHTGLLVRTVFHLTTLCMAIAFFAYALLIIGFKGRFKGGIYFVFALEILLYGYLLFGKPTFITNYSEEPEQENEYISICNQLTEALDLEPSYVSRIKNADETMNSNYGFVLERPALSNWTHVISPRVSEGASLLGYSCQFTRVLDAGGTVFTDALLGINNVISCIPMDDALYDALDSAEVLVDKTTGEYRKYTLYQCRYTLPFGKVVHKLKGYTAENLDLVSVQNILYAALIDGLDSDVEAGEKKNHKIAGWIYNEKQSDSEVYVDCDVETKQVHGDTERIETYTMQVTGNKALYFSGAGADTEYYNTKITVNGMNVHIPSIKEIDNELYPAHFNNNVIYLGTFENQKVVVEISKDISIADFNTELSYVNISKLSALCARRSSFAAKAIVTDNTVEVTTTCSDSDENANLLLPITFDKGWEIKINGRKINNEASVVGLFTLIPLVNGSNDVTMEFVPKGMRLGTIISIIALVLSIGYAIMSNLPQKDVFSPEEEAEAIANGYFDDGNRFEVVMHSLEHILHYVYLAVFVLVFIVMYLIPIVYGLFECINRL